MQLAASLDGEKCGLAKDTRKRICVEPLFLGTKGAKAPISCKRKKCVFLELAENEKLLSLALGEGGLLLQLLLVCCPPLRKMRVGFW